MADQPLHADRSVAASRSLTAAIASAGVVLALCVALVAGENPQMRIVLLNDGRVFRGTLTEVPGGYRVDNGSSYLILPFTEIQLTADSLQDAYKKLRDSVRNPTARDHMALADWCFKQGLIADSRTEVASALQLEPDRSDARVMLQRLDRIVQPPSLDTTRQGSPLGMLSFVKAPERNEQGLTAETMREFVTRVQPLLMNSCGQATCHGNAATNDFHIDYARIGTPGHRQATDDNLQAAFSQIDAAEPLKSPILTTPGRPDPHHRELFRGNIGGKQFQILRDWVQAAAKEHSEPSRPRRPEVAQAPPVLFRPDPVEGEGIATRTPIRDPEIQTASMDVAENIVTGSPPSSRTDSSSEISNPDRLLDQLRRRSQPDAFDPDIFNRKVHGVSAAEVRSRQSPASGR